MKELSFSAARQCILDHINQPLTERKKPLAALGQTLAESIHSTRNVPDWDFSARDGFAVRSADIRSALTDCPVVLRVRGRILAGQASAPEVVSGSAVRIMTGAPVPPGADCIVAFEDTRPLPGKKKDGTRIEILKAIEPQGNIRYRGEQVPAGLEVLAWGQIIGPGEVNLLASLGITEITVLRRPEIAVITSGEELVPPGRPLGFAQIYSGNAAALAAQVLRCGGIPRVMSIARDSLTAIRQRVRRGLSCDLIISTGGSAMGDRDLIKEVISESGQVLFDQIHIKPGKTTAFGILPSSRTGLPPVPHLALSGSPSAAMLGFEALARPAIMKMRGRDHSFCPLPARAAQAFPNPGGRTHLEWVSLRHNEGCLEARSSELPGSGILVSLTGAEGLAVIPADQKMVAAGTMIPVVPLNWK